MSGSGAFDLALDTIREEALPLSVGVTIVTRQSKVELLPQIQRLQSALSL